MVCVYADLTAQCIFMQRIAANGSLIGGAVPVSNVSGSSTGEPRIETLSNGSFVVTWKDDSNTFPDNDITAVHAQLYNANGAEVGTGGRR